MKKLSLLLGGMLVLCQIINAQRNDKKLQRLLEKEITGFNGTIGIYVKNLKNGKTVCINADTLFPTASIVKVPILIGIMDRLHKKELKYDSVFTYLYKDSLLYPGEDILGEFKDGGQIRLKKLVMLMLTTSDNTASLWLQKIAGTGTRINHLLDSFGFVNTRVNSRTEGREGYRKVYGWGQTTPREIAEIFETIYQGKMISPVASEMMMRSLGRNFWDELSALSQVPPYIEVFSKNGAINQNRNEILLVNAPHNPYILSIFTKNNKDQRWVMQNEAWVLTRKISALLWRYFEPKDKWVKPRE